MELNIEAMGKSHRDFIKNLERMTVENKLSPSEINKLLGLNNFKDTTTVLHVFSGLLNLQDQKELMSQENGDKPYSEAAYKNPYVTKINGLMVVDVPDSTIELDTLGELSSDGLLLFENLISAKVDIVIFSENGLDVSKWF